MANGATQVAILVTGNLGYVGPLVVQQLRRAEVQHEIIGVDLGYYAHCALGPTFLADEQLLCDLRHSSAALQWSLARCQAVVHLAAISNDPMGKAFEQPTAATNFAATLELARQAKLAGVRRFVFASSCSVYGAAGDRPRTEDDEVEPLTAYARSKMRSEAALAELADENFQVTCLRFATACGASPGLRLDLVLNDFVCSALHHGRIEVCSDGSPLRPLIHVEDMARAIDWACQREAGGEFLRINAGCDAWNFRIADLAHAVAQEFSGIKVDINHAAPPDRRSYRVDFSRFRDLAPNHQPQATMPNTVAGLRSQLLGLCFGEEGFRRSQWIRLVELRAMARIGLLDEKLAWTSDLRPVVTPHQPLAAAA